MTVFYHFFIGRFCSDEEAYSRARLIINFILISIALSLLFALLHSQFQFHIPQWLFVSFAAVLTFVLFLFRAPLSISQMAHVIIGIAWVSFICGIMYSGGIYSMIVPWLLLMPLMANLLIQRKAATIWMVISALSLLYLMFFFDSQPMTDDSKSSWRALIANMGLVIVIFLFTESF